MKKNYLYPFLVLIVFAIMILFNFNVSSALNEPINDVSISLLGLQASASSECNPSPGCHYEYGSEHCYSCDCQWWPNYAPDCLFCC